MLWLPTVITASAVLLAVLIVVLVGTAYVVFREAPSLELGWID